MYVNQEQNTTAAIHVLWGTSVPRDRPSLSLALPASLVTSLVLGQEASVTHVQPGRLPTCRLRRRAFPVAAPPPRLQVRSHSGNNIQPSIGSAGGTPFRSRLSPQALPRAPASGKIERSNTRTAHVCAEPDLSSTTIWISKARPQIVYMTASLRSVGVLINVTCLHLFGFYSPYTEIIIIIKKDLFACKTHRVEEKYRDALTYGHVGRVQ